MGEERLQGGPARLGLDLGGELQGLGRLRELATAGYHELRQALLRDYYAFLLVHAGAVDPSVQVHPAVPGTSWILPFGVVVRNCGVRYGGAYYRRNVLYGGDVVLRYLGLDVGGRVHGRVAATLVLNGGHRVGVHAVRITLAREEGLAALLASGVSTHVTSRTRHYVLLAVVVVGVVVFLGDSLRNGVIVVALDAVYAQISGVTGEGGQGLELRQAVQRLRAEYVLYGVHRHLRLDLAVALIQRGVQQELVRTEVAHRAVQDELVGVHEFVLDAGVRVLPAG